MAVYILAAWCKQINTMSQKKRSSDLKKNNVHKLPVLSINTEMLTDKDVFS